MRLWRILRQLIILLLLLTLLPLLFINLLRLLIDLLRLLIDYFPTFRNFYYFLLPSSFLLNLLPLLTYPASVRPVSATGGKGSAFAFFSVELVILRELGREATILHLASKLLLGALVEERVLLFLATASHPGCREGPFPAGGIIIHNSFLDL